MNIIQHIGNGVLTVALSIASLLGFSPEPTYLPQVPDAAEESVGRAVNPVATNNYVIAGSGISSSATTITLTSFTAPVSGAPYTMANFGDGANAKGYLTIEPGSRTRQEIVSFTGITQNSDGTATLTGVTRGLLPFSPFTASSTYAIAHNGGAQVTVSDPPQLYDAIYSYIDNATTSGAVDGTTLIKGIYETATGQEAASTTAIGGGNTTATLVLTSLLSTSTAPSSGNVIPVTKLNGKLDRGFITTATTTTFVASTTYTKPTGLVYIDLEMWGGGGGGESNGGTSAGGGGGGEYKFFRIPASSISASTDVTVGAGGAPETAGGNTSFGSFIAYGGGGAPAVSGGNGAYGGFENGNGSSMVQGMAFSTPSAVCNSFGSCPDSAKSKATSTVFYGGAGGTVLAGGVGGSGGDSVYGGAGGSAGGVSSAGATTTSVMGGAGGAGKTSGEAGPGQFPAGGGGGAYNGTGGRGANGMVRITEYY